jgi:hypothetical protein
MSGFSADLPWPIDNALPNPETVAIDDKKCLQAFTEKRSKLCYL